MKFLIKNPRKGVSIAEMTIALGVIMIIMVASISLLKTSVSVAIRSSAIIEANNTAESIIECFNYSNDAGEFKSKLDNLHGKCTEDAILENGLRKYIIDCGSYKIEINYLEYPKIEGDHGVRYARIEINAIYSDGTQIYKEKIIYYKGL